MHVKVSIVKKPIKYNYENKMTMQVGENEVSHLLECTGYHHHPHMTSLHFDPRALPPRELPCYALKIFTDLGFHRKYVSRVLCDASAEMFVGDWWEKMNEECKGPLPTVSPRCLRGTA